MNRGCSKTKWSADLRKKLWASEQAIARSAAQMSRGSSTGDDTVFLVGHSTRIEPGAVRVPLFATGFTRYAFSQSSEWRVIFPYAVDAEKSRLLTESELSDVSQSLRALKSNMARLGTEAVCGVVRVERTPEIWYCMTALDRDSAFGGSGVCSLIPENLRGKLSRWQAAGLRSRSIRKLADPRYLCPRSSQLTTSVLGTPTDEQSIPRGLANLHKAVFR